MGNKSVKQSVENHEVLHDLPGKTFKIKENQSTKIYPSPKTISRSRTDNDHVVKSQNLECKDICKTESLREREIILANLPEGVLDFYMKLPTRSPEPSHGEKALVRTHVDELHAKLPVRSYKQNVNNSDYSCEVIPVLNVTGSSASDESWKSANSCRSIGNDAVCTQPTQSFIMASSPVNSSPVYKDSSQISTLAEVHRSNLPLTSDDDLDESYSFIRHNAGEQLTLNEISAKNQLDLNSRRDIRTNTTLVSCADVGINTMNSTPNFIGDICSQEMLPENIIRNPQELSRNFCSDVGGSEILSDHFNRITAEVAVQTNFRSTLQMGTQTTPPTSRQESEPTCELMISEDSTLISSSSWTEFDSPSASSSDAWNQTEASACNLNRTNPNTATIVRKQQAKKYSTVPNLIPIDGINCDVRHLSPINSVAHPTKPSNRKNSIVLNKIAKRDLRKGRRKTPMMFAVASATEDSEVDESYRKESSIVEFRAGRFSSCRSSREGSYKISKLNKRDFYSKNFRCDDSIASKGSSNNIVLPLTPNIENVADKIFKVSNGLADPQIFLTNREEVNTIDCDTVVPYDAQLPPLPNGSKQSINSSETLLKNPAVNSCSNTISKFPLSQPDAVKSNLQTLLIEEKCFEPTQSNEIPNIVENISMDSTNRNSMEGDNLTFYTDIMKGMQSLDTFENELLDMKEKLKDIERLVEVRKTTQEKCADEVGFQQTIPSALPDLNILQDSCDTNGSVSSVVSDDLGHKFQREEKSYVSLLERIGAAKRSEVYGNASLRDLKNNNKAIGRVNKVNLDQSQSIGLNAIVCLSAVERNNLISDSETDFRSSRNQNTVTSTIESNEHKIRQPKCYSYSTDTCAEGENDVSMNAKDLASASVLKDKSKNDLKAGNHVAINTNKHSMELHTLASPDYTKNAKQDVITQYNENSTPTNLLKFDNGDICSETSQVPRFPVCTIGLGRPTAVVVGLPHSSTFTQLGLVIPGSPTMKNRINSGSNNSCYCADKLSGNSNNLRSDISTKTSLIVNLPNKTANSNREFDKNTMSAEISSKLSSGLNSKNNLTNLNKGTEKNTKVTEGKTSFPANPPNKLNNSNRDCVNGITTTEISNKISCNLNTKNNLANLKEEPCKNVKVVDTKTSFSLNKPNKLTSSSDSVIENSKDMHSDLNKVESNSTKKLDYAAPRVRVIRPRPRPVLRDSADGHLVYKTGDVIKRRFLGLKGLITYIPSAREWTNMSTKRSQTRRLFFMPDAFPDESSLTSFLQEDEIVRTLGEGTFGKVVECKDSHRNNERVALKVIKNITRYREAARFEIGVLQKIADLDPLGESLCVRMTSWFVINGHVCISFPVLGLSVYDFMKHNSFQPYPIDQVRHICYQLCRSVKFLHDNNLTHTDLKPENILFVNSDSDVEFNNKKKENYRRVRCTDVRLIDFGSATFDHEHHSTIVSTRHYRAPEVILEVGWHHPCDVWSIGCILFELYTGCTLFQTHSNREHLAMMENAIGKIPEKLYEKSRKNYFENNKLISGDENKPNTFVKHNWRSLLHYVTVDDSEHRCLYDLMTMMLDYDVTERITATDALRHPFFSKLSAVQILDPELIDHHHNIQTHLMGRVSR